MYKDIINYELADGISQEHLLATAEEIVTNWMRKQAGFIQWEIHSSSDGSYTDIVTWESQEAAQKAEKDMVNIPNAASWYGCYKEGSISSKNLTRLAAF